MNRFFFLNRRGYAPSVICKKCGGKLECPNCSIFLTFHKHLNKLICTIVVTKLFKNANAIKIIIIVNSKCTDLELKKSSELRQIFPEKKISKYVSDRLSIQKNETENLLEDIEKNKVNILVRYSVDFQRIQLSKPKLYCSS